MSAYTQPSCPSCGETPMFRSIVHDCCVEVVEIKERILAIFEPSRWLQEADAQEIETAVMLALLPSQTTDPAASR